MDNTNTDNFIFAFITKSGMITVGEAENAGHKIAMFNSGELPEEPERLTIHRLLGIKPETEGTNLGIYC